MSKENWGRWGPTDERGALNLLSPERVVQAAKLVRLGRVFSLGLPISRNTPTPKHRVPVSHFMDRDGGDYAAGAKRPGGFQFADDTVILPTHVGTHIDALAHAWYGDQLYNGFSSDGIRSTTGARHCGIDKAGPVVGRGVLLDVAGYLGTDVLPAGCELTGRDLEACARSQGVSVGEGDVVLIRTGWIRHLEDAVRFFEGEPGPGPDAGLWLAEQRVAAVGADNYALEVLPRNDGAVFPVHQYLIRDCGVPLLEGLVLDALADQRSYEFLFVALPLPIVGATASPLNPIAVV